VRPDQAGRPAYRYDGTGAPKTAWQMDEYVLNGEGEEIYTPRFTFHGFRYVEVTGFPGQPTLSALERAPAQFRCGARRLLRLLERAVQPGFKRWCNGRS